MVHEADAGYALFDTALGRCGVAWGPTGLRAVLLCGSRDAEGRQQLAKRGGAEAEDGAMPRFVREAIRSIRAHLGGDLRDLSQIPVELDGIPPFHRIVYRRVRAVGPGRTVSYGELAAELGGANRARAVGQAMARNPLLLVVPCHRVLGRDGAPGGFSAVGGVETKLRLLAIEGVDVAEASQLALFHGQGRLGFDAVEAVEAVARADRTLARLIRRSVPFQLRTQHTQSPFEALAESIVYQQLSGKAAATIFGRFKGLYPRGRFPSPEQLLATSEELLRSAGISRGKMLALRDLARKALDGTVPELRALESMGDDEIVERLTAVRGIGRWTVEMLLIFRLGRPDVLPVDDWGIRKGFQKAYGLSEPPRPRELLAHGERWRPYRTVASWYLWRANEA